MIHQELSHRFHAAKKQHKKKYQDNSQKRLMTNVQKKFNTTMIGALAKFEEGDRIVSYDWFQPQSMNLAMGADIYYNPTGALKWQSLGALSEASVRGINTVVDQPLFLYLTKLHII